MAIPPVISIRSQDTIYRDLNLSPFEIRILRADYALRRLERILPTLGPGLENWNFRQGASDWSLEQQLALFDAMGYPHLLEYPIEEKSIAEGLSPEQLVALIDERPRILSMKLGQKVTDEQLRALDARMDEWIPPINLPEIRTLEDLTELAKTLSHQQILAVFFFAAQHPDVIHALVQGIELEQVVEMVKSGHGAQLVPHMKDVPYQAAFAKSLVDPSPLFEMHWNGVQYVMPHLPSEMVDGLKELLAKGAFTELEGDQLGHYIERIPFILLAVAMTDETLFQHMLLGLAALDRPPRGPVAATLATNCSTDAQISALFRILRSPDEKLQQWALGWFPKPLKDALRNHAGSTQSQFMERLAAWQGQVDYVKQQIETTNPDLTLTTMTKFFEIANSLYGELKFRGRLAILSPEMDGAKWLSKIEQDVETVGTLI